MIGWFESEVGTTIGYEDLAVEDICLLTELTAAPSIGEDVKLDSTSTQSRRRFALKVEFSTGEKLRLWYYRI